MRSKTGRGAQAILSLLLLGSGVMGAGLWGCRRIPSAPAASATARPATPAASARPATPSLSRSATPSIDALVVAVRPDVGLVIVSVGADDGVRRGFTFHIWRDDKFIAKAIVEKVWQNQCSARIVMPPKDEVREGDNASTRIL